MNFRKAGCDVRWNINQPQKIPDDSQSISIDFRTYDITNSIKNNFNSRYKRMYNALQKFSDKSMPLDWCVQLNYNHLLKLILSGLYLEYFENKTVI